MKVLMVAPYLYNQNLKGFQKNKTGFGILLDQMVDYIGRDCDLYFWSNVITPKKKHYNSIIVKHTWWEIIRNATIKEIIKGIYSALKSKDTIRNRLLYIYYRMNCGSLRRLIQEIKPDIIHCHGVGKKYLYYINVCLESDIPVVNTLHGLIGLDDSIDALDEDKESESKFLKNYRVPTIVISTGILNRIIEGYGLADTNNIDVITNGTNTSPIKKGNDIRKKHCIPDDNLIIIAVGNVYRNKNQVQIIRSILLLPNEVLSKVTLLILGKISTDYNIEEAIDKLNVSNSVRCCGFIESREIGDYYASADLNVLASINEGFGLSMIEGFVYGVPCVTFSDLDAVPDLYNENAMVLAGERTDQALAEAIAKALDKKWNHPWIKEYSKQFSLDKMARNYISEYMEIINAE